MANFEIGDKVRISMPKGRNKRGVVGISVMYTTWPEARFDEATGEVVEINPRGPYGVPLYLVNFRGQQNRVTIPWQAQWFREEWLTNAEAPRKEPVATVEGLAAPEGWGQTTTGESS